MIKRLKRFSRSLLAAGSTYRQEGKSEAIFAARTIASSKAMLTESKPSVIPDAVRKVLEGKNFVYLGTTFQDGSPQVTPVWVDIEGKYVLVNTAVGRVKYRNIQRNPKVALGVADWSNPYNFIQIRGRVVELVKGQAAEDHIDRLNMKYHGKPKYTKRPGEHRVILKIEPERVTSWG